MSFLRINMTDKEMYYNAHDGVGIFHFRVKDTNGHELPLTQTGEDSLGYSGAGFLQFINLKPGEGREYKFDLNKLFDFKKSGEYTIEAFQIITKGNPADAHDPKRIELLSNKLIISVH